MGQNVKVERDLELRGYANTVASITGVFMPKKKIYDEGFPGDAALYGWDEEETNGGTVAHAAVDGGAETLTTGAVLYDCAELSHTAQWTATNSCGVEIKLKMSRITAISVCAGLVDEKEDTNDHAAGEISGVTLRTPTVTDEAALFIFDTDQNTDVWYVGAVKASTAGTAVAASGSLAPVADTYFKIRVQTDTLGNVTFYYNGVAVGYRPTAITVAGLLTPYVGIVSRTTSAGIVTVSRITTWQDN